MILVAVGEAAEDDTINVISDKLGETDQIDFAHINLGIARGQGRW